jgi:hypothetical protein
VIKMSSGQTIIRHFLRRDTGKYNDEIVIQELRPEPRVPVLNMDNVEHVHRIVAVGDPWPEDARATPKPPPAG